MAVGTFTWFTAAKLAQYQKIHNFNTDTFKYVFVKNQAGGGINLVETTTDPRYGTGGTTNLATSEVAAGGNYLAGGLTITNMSAVIDGANVKIDSDDLALVGNLANPNNGYYGVIYNDTDTGKRAIGYVDHGGVLDLTQGDYNYTVPLAGWATAQ